MLEAIWRILLQLAPWLLLGTLVAALLHGLLPRDFVRRRLQGYRGVLQAVAVGVPMPLCSCGVIPAGLGLKRDGASDGASVGFLISTPQTGVDSVLVSGSFLGWPFALFKVASAAVTGIVGGWLTERAGRSGPGAQVDADSSESEDRSWRGMADHGLMILRSVWRWLVVGVIVSAAIEVLVPAPVLAGLGSLGPLGAAVAALLVSLPLYVCATASVPIAAALVAGGMPTGAALVFLMAGPATNVATIGAVYRGFGRRTLAIYLATIVVGSVGFGVLFDFVLGGAAATAAAHHEPTTWWAVVSAVVLLALLAWFALGDLRRFLGRLRAAGESERQLEVAVEGMSCGGCVAKLESALLADEDVTSAAVSLTPGRAAVRGSIPAARLRRVVQEAGFRPVG